MTKSVQRHQQLAASFDALGHPRRIKIYLALVTKNRHEMTFGALATATNLKPSVLSHHLRKMKEGRLIRTYAMGSRTKVSLTNNAHWKDISSLIAS